MDRVKEGALFVKAKKGQTGENSPYPCLEVLLEFSSRIAAHGDGSGMASPPDELMDLNDDTMKLLRNAFLEMRVAETEFLRSVISLFERIARFHESGLESEWHMTMEQLDDRLTLADSAKVFYELGGMEKAIPLLDKKYSEHIRYEAAKVIFHSCQSNLYCQRMSTTEKVFLPLMTLATDHYASNAASVAMSAILAIIQNNQRGIEMFHKHDGLSMLIKNINSDYTKLISEGFHCINILLMTDCIAKEDMITLNVVRTLITKMKDPKNNDLETLLEYALLNLVTLSDLPEAVAICNEEQYGLNDFLNSVIEERQADDANKKIVKYATTLQKRMTKTDN